MLSFLSSAVATAKPGRHHTPADQRSAALQPVASAEPTPTRPRWYEQGKNVVAIVSAACAVITMTGNGLGGWFALQTRLAVAEQKITALDERIAGLQGEVQRMDADIKQLLQRGTQTR